MRQFKVTDEIKDFFGDVIMEEDQSLTYGKVMVLSLMANFPEDQKLPMEEKLHRFSLAQKIANALMKKESLNLDPVEVTAIRTCAHRALTVYSFGALNRFLNGD